MMQALPIDDRDRPLAGQPSQTTGTPRAPVVTHRSYAPGADTTPAAIPVEDDRFVSEQEEPRRPKRERQRPAPRAQESRSERLGRRELPPPGMPGTGIKPERFTNNNSIGAIVRGGMNFITNTFGLNRDVGPDDPGVQAFARGEGAATQQQVKQIDQMAGLDQLEPHIRSIGRLDAAVSYHMAHGNADKAREAAGQLLLYSKRAAMMHGNAIASLVERGDIPGAVRVAERAYAEIPDGNKLEADLEGSQGRYRIIDRNGQLTDQGEFTTDTLMQLALGMQDGTAWFRMMAGIASEPMTENQRAERANDARRLDLTERDIARKEREFEAEQSGRSGGTRRVSGGSVATAAPDLAASWQETEEGQRLADAARRVEGLGGMSEDQIAADEQFGPTYARMRDQNVPHEQAVAAIQSSINRDMNLSMMGYIFETLFNDNSLNSTDRGRINDAFDAVFDGFEGGEDGEAPSQTLNARRKQLSVQITQANGNVPEVGIVVASMLTDPELATKLFTREDEDGNVVPHPAIQDGMLMVPDIGPVAVPRDAYMNAFRLAKERGSLGEIMRGGTSGSNPEASDRGVVAWFRRLRENASGETRSERNSRRSRTLGEEQTIADRVADYFANLFSRPTPPNDRVQRRGGAVPETKRPAPAPSRPAAPGSRPEEIPQYGRSDATNSIAVPAPNSRSAPARSGVDPAVGEALRGRSGATPAQRERQSRRGGAARN